MSRICIDMDGVMADTYVKFIDRYEARFGRRPSDLELRGKKIYELEGAEDIRNAMYEPGFFRDLAVMPGAVTIVEELYAAHEVFVVTTATEFKHCLIDKWEWLEEHFPFIHHQRIVLCGSKSIVWGDYMIDDKVSNLEGFKGKKLLFSARDNYFATGYQRVNNWQEVQQYFQQEKATGAIG
ncbi:MAG: 5'(3')-deoxyribonucleotidase [Bacteroidota bacterium]